MISGVSIACVVLVGAAFEIGTNDGAPKVFGGQHLAVFSQPARSRVAERPRAAGLENVATTAPAPRTAAPQTAQATAIDFETTATIGKERDRVVQDGVLAIGAPTLVYVERGQGAFEARAGRVMLRVGDAAPGGGVIRSFQRRGGRWVAIVAREQTSR